MPRWTLASVEKAAPDPASLTAARRLAVRGPWSETGSTETLVWGKCQGSGKTPYQVSIDLTGPAYRCSCPSRKFPCKHALALLLLWIKGDGSVADDTLPPAGLAPAPTDVRLERKPADPEARAKRQAERFATMSAGVEDFALWLGDLVRNGTVAARRQSWGWWDAGAARLVDAQLPGLAERVRDMGSQVNGRADWADHLLVELGRWWTAVQAWRRWDDLDERTRADLRTYVGWARASEDVRAGETVTDTWLVLGAHRSDDGRLVQQRTWLRGERSGRWVQLLDFAVGGGVLPVAHLAGTVLDATLALYPGSQPQRGLVTDDPTVHEERAALPLGGSLEDALAALATASAANPWVTRVPALLDSAALLPHGDDGLQVVDARGDALPLLLGDEPPWTALALTGGRPTTLLGEVEHAGFRVLSVQTDDRLITV